MSGLKEKDKLTERAAGSSGIEEKEERGRLLFTLRRSRRLTGLVPSTKNRGEERKTGKRRRIQGKKNQTNRVSHGESEINRKEIIMLIRIRYKIDIKCNGV